MTNLNNQLTPDQQASPDKLCLCGRPISYGDCEPRDTIICTCGRGHVVPERSSPKPTPAPKSSPRSHLTPGAYMRECRLRAGLTLAQCAQRVATPDRQIRACHDLERLERDVPGDYGLLVRCLQDSGAFPFDFATFVALAAETCDPSLDRDATR